MVRLILQLFRNGFCFDAAAKTGGITKFIPETETGRPLWIVGEAALVALVVKTAWLRRRSFPRLC